MPFIREISFVVFNLLVLDKKIKERRYILKKLKNLFIFASLCLISSFITVKAGGYSFEITTNSAWGREDGFVFRTKTDSASVSSIVWDASNKTNHKMWFRVLDMNEKVRGAVKINYLSSGYAVTNNTMGASYILEAKRENIIDPMTTVSGRWLP